MINFLPQHTKEFFIDCMYKVKSAAEPRILHTSISFGSSHSHSKNPNITRRRRRRNDFPREALVL